MNLELMMLGGAILLLLCIFASKLSSRLGIPAMVLFMVVGMLAGSEGPGGILMDNPLLVQSVGVFALSYILFAGGLDTDWRQIRPLIREGFVLSTIGVGVTAFLVGWFVHAVLGFSWLEGLLLGSIVSSTDAAAVFAVLRSRNVHLKGNLKPLLELESGSNDPMAVLLTTTMILLLNNPTYNTLKLIPLVFWQMAIGAAVGYLLGKVSVLLINRLRLDYEGLYSVFTLTSVPLIYAVASMIKSNGFLAVYIAGLVMGNSAFVQKKSLLRFHDGLAWLMQITMFTVLGLQVFPSHLVPVILSGLLVAAFLMIVARPLSVMLGLSFSRLALNEKGLISWVGLRGSVPIVLATFPLVAGLDKADIIFNLVFFIVLTSALLQGSSIPVISRLLKVGADGPTKPFPLPDSEAMADMSKKMQELHVPAHSPVVGKQLVEISLPKDLLVVYIQRDDEYLIPHGNAVITAGDRLFVLADEKALDTLRLLING
ncbi:MAG: potassium/proton antiporter [Geobacteraceae bacterium]|nr:potassium/proton antiporter [Geobacteraceae bacterium]